MLLNIMLTEDYGPTYTKYGVHEAVMITMASHMSNPVILEWG